MIEIYKTAWLHFRRNLGTLLILAAMLFLLRIAKVKWDLSVGATLVPQMIVVMFLHHMVLFGEKVNMIHKQDRKLAIGPFLIASLIIIAFSGIASLVILRFSGLTTDQMFKIWILVFALCDFVFMVLLGTSLPASVAGDRYNPKISLIRAKSTWAAIAGGFIAGPVVATAILFAVVIVFLQTFGTAIEAFPTLGGVNFLGVFIDFIWRIAALFTSLLGVVVLCRAYLRVAPPEILAELAAAKQTEV
jgi:hypothetical protein